jgi:hypothetical protein
VVTGLRRVQAAIGLGWSSIPARLLSADTSVSHCLLVHLHDNAFSRGFNPAEQAALATRLLHHWDRQTVAARYLPYLGLPPSPRLFERLLALGRLEPEFLELAAAGRLALNAGAALAKWPAADRAAVLPFLAGLPLSHSKQEELLEHTALLARREGAAARDILARPELQEIIADPDLEGPERLRRLRQRLHGWLTPRFCAAQEAFNAALGRLGLRNHHKIRLSPPPAFEGPDFTLEIKFAGPGELQAILGEVANLAKAPELRRVTGL